VTEQLDWPAVAVAERVQLPFENVPVPELENETAPDGRLFVPESVSLTVAVHVVEPLTPTEDGTHATSVVVERLVTETVFWPELVRWVVEPP
jgi:hypothetical protein